ncbi:hypothetical protein ACROYT_G015068 [Oculina patagonica]
MAKCKFCEAAFSLDQAKDHTRQCTEVELSCTLCGDSLKRKEQTAHTSQCPMWPVKCECGETYRQSEKARHEIVCSFEKINCPLDCDTWVESLNIIFCLIAPGTIITLLFTTGIQGSEKDESNVEESQEEEEEQPMESKKEDEEEEEETDWATLEDSAPSAEDYSSQSDYDTETEDSSNTIMYSVCLIEPSS